MAIHSSSSVIFSLPKFALIYFDLDTWTTNNCRVIDKVLDTDVPYKVVPINCCSRPNLLYLGMVEHI